MASSCLWRFRFQLPLALLSFSVGFQRVEFRIVSAQRKKGWLMLLLLTLLLLVAAAAAPECCR